MSQQFEKAHPRGAFSRPGILGAYAGPFLFVLLLHIA
jgi:hypothetical protein